VEKSCSAGAHAPSVAQHPKLGCAVPQHCLPLSLAAQRKINSYRQQYADNQNISFLPAIMSTSTRMHGEFLLILFDDDAF
jgi:hypothetical protein